VALPINGMSLTALRAAADAKRQPQSNYPIGAKHMSDQAYPKFEGGKNIAMKLPSHVFYQTVAFYKDVLRLPIREEEDSSVIFEFGVQRLWLDRVDHFSQAEIWLELITNDVEAAAGYLDNTGTVRRDEIEPLPEGFDGFWITNPANISHLISRQEE
jgi:hypothetical protein